MRIETGQPSAFHCKVLLNGVELKRCIWADDVTGEACVYQVDALGAIIHDGVTAATEIRHGWVELRAHPDHPFEVAP